MKKNIIDGIDKVLNSNTSNLSSNDVEELKKIRKQAHLANTKEKLFELTLYIVRFLTNNNDFFT